MRYDTASASTYQKIGCYQATMSTFNFENSGYLNILGVTSDSTAKTVDVIADNYETKAKYTDGELLWTTRY
mgnify:CR=1 FL=1